MCPIFQCTGEENDLSGCVRFVSKWKITEKMAVAYDKKVSRKISKINSDMNCTNL